MSNEMITSYKESSTKEELNEKLNWSLMQRVFKAAHWSGLYGKILHG